MIFSTFMFEKVIENQQLSSIKDIIFSTFEQMEKKLDCKIPKILVLLVLLLL